MSTNDLGTELLESFGEVPIDVVLRFKSLLQYVYWKSFNENNNPNGLMKLLFSASLYQVKPLLLFCRTKLTKLLSRDNAFAWANDSFDKFNHLYAKCEEKILQSYNTLLRADFADLEKPVLIDVIQSDHIYSREMDMVQENRFRD